MKNFVCRVVYPGSIILIHNTLIKLKTQTTEMSRSQFFNLDVEKVATNRPHASSRHLSFRNNSPQIDDCGLGDQTHWFSCIFLSDLLREDAGWQVLQDRGETGSRYGRATFSVLLLQDLAVVLVFMLVPLLAPTSDGTIHTMAILKAMAEVRYVQSLWGASKKG